MSLSRIVIGKKLIAVSIVVALLLSACTLVRINLPQSADTATPVTAAPATATVTPPATAQPSTTAQPTPTHVPRASSTPRPTSTPPTADSDPIPSQPITETLRKADNFHVIMRLRADAKIGFSKPVTGDMRLEIIADQDEGSRVVIMSGALGLLSDELQASQVTTFSLFTVDGNVYTLEERPSQQAKCTGLDAVSIDSRAGEIAKLYERVSSYDEPLTSAMPPIPSLYGTLAGEETIQDVAVRHYVIDGEATQWANRIYPTQLRLATGDAYIAVKGEHILRFAGEYEGAMYVGSNRYGAGGRYGFEMELRGLNAGVSIQLPKACARAARAAAQKSRRLTTRLSWDAEEITSYQSTYLIDLNGKDERGKSLRGQLAMAVTNNRAANEQAITVSGDLIGKYLEDPGLAEMGVTAVSAYKVGGVAYFTFEMEHGEHEFCTRISEDEYLESYQYFLLGDLVVLSTYDALYGKLAGKATVNGVKTAHYVLDPAASNEAWQKRGDSEGGDKLLRGDVYIASRGNYVVRMAAAYDGEMPDMQFKGVMNIRYDLVALNAAASRAIKLPEACEQPIRDDQMGWAHGR